MEIVNGVFTGVLILLFLGIWVWAWSARNKNKFDRMSSLPLEDEVQQQQEVKDEQ